LHLLQTIAAELNRALENLRLLEARGQVADARHRTVERQ
jgi:hypothetical protein